MKSIGLRFRCSGDDARKNHSPFTLGILFLGLFLVLANIPSILAVEIVDTDVGLLKDNFNLYVDRINDRFDINSRIPNPADFFLNVVQSSPSEEVSQFEEMFEIVNGTWRTKLSFFNRTQGTEDVAGVMIYSDYPLNDNIKRLMLALNKNLKSYALSTQNTFLNRYTTLEVGIEAIYPKEWVFQRVHNDSSFKDEIWYYSADPQHDPQKESVWTPAYYDPVLQGWMTSLITPIYEGDKFIGVTGGDIFLEEIYNQIKSYTYDNKGYSFIFDEEKNILVHPNYAKEITRKGESEELLSFKDIQERELSRQVSLINKESGLITYTEEGKDFIFLYQKLKHNNWYYGFVIEFSKVSVGKLVESSAGDISDSTLIIIQKVKDTFYHLKDSDVEMIKGKLTEFMNNDSYKQTFQKRDREKLYQLSLPIFQKNKNESGLTHFYYITPEGTIFLRVHNKGIFNDSINRITYLQAKKEDSWGSGLELGKTAFALRVVHPYEYQGQSIGYVEFGEEIEHFLPELKSQMNLAEKIDFAVIVNKNYIDPQQWASVRKNKGLRDNYNDLTQNVIIDTTRSDDLVFSKLCLSEAELSQVSENGNVFRTCSVGEKTFIIGGFTLLDAAQNKVGAVVVAQDVTEFTSSGFSKISQNTYWYIIAGLILGILLILFVSLRHWFSHREEEMRGKEKKQFKERTFSLRKKLLLAFGFLLMLIIILSVTTYLLNQRITNLTTEIREVEAPLGLMVEQVVSYDAQLTENAYAALLHAQVRQMDDFYEHKYSYDQIGILLDDLLKNKAPTLLRLSSRSEVDKQKVLDLLNELDQINLALVDLETAAFVAAEKGDVKKAQSLIVIGEYPLHKNKLAELYHSWEEEEARIVALNRQQIIDNTFNVRWINLLLGALSIILGMIIAIIMSGSIVNPLKKLAAATREIEKGNYKVRTEIKTGDELEDLGIAFNKTTERLDKIDEDRKSIDRAKTQFLSITSHELRSPMTPMKAQLQMLKEGYFGKLNKQQKESMSIVLNNTERLDKILLDFLEISRIEAARLKFNFVKTHLEENIQLLVEEMQGFLPEKSLKLELKVSKLPVFEVDPDRVMQVLRNLINNAMKFSNIGSKVLINVSKEGKEILFRVQDFGTGIKKEDQIRIFEPFFQSDNMYQHKSGGTGLGLAICKGIVESQKGRIGFQSEFGKGTTFYFTVPLTPIKEISPIRILFSQKNDLEPKLKKVLLDFLGPLGEKEFEELKIKGLVKENFMEYISFLVKKGIILREKSEEFKNQIILTIDGEKEVGEVDLNRKVSSKKR